MLLNCGVGEDSGESLGLQGDPTSQGVTESDTTEQLHFLSIYTTFLGYLRVSKT